MRSKLWQRQRLHEVKKRTVRMNGCVASAQAAKYADVDVITAYPIRPYTATMMALAQMVANGELDAEYIRGRQRALAIEHRARRCVERRARFHRQLGRRRAVRVRALFADLGQPHAGADDDRRPHARSSRRFRFRAYRRAVDTRHGVADGLVVRCPGSIRQSPDRLSNR